MKFMLKNKNGKCFMLLHIMTSLIIYKIEESAI